MLAEAVPAEFVVFAVFVAAPSEYVAAAGNVFVAEFDAVAVDDCYPQYLLWEPELESTSL